MHFSSEAEADRSMLAPTIVLALLAIAGGIWVTVPGFPYSLASMAVARLVP
jgi:biopolymer transport protein ExbB/TolQ